MANLITGLRIVCAAGMIFCPTFSAWFYILYAVGAISDVIDGKVARHFKKESAFGARLDTAADIVFTAVALIKVILAVKIPIWQIIWIILIAVIKFAGIFIGVLIYKKFICEHTAINKVCGVLLFLSLPCMGVLPRQAQTVLAAVICIAATFAAFEEIYYILKGKEIR